MFCKIPRKGVQLNSHSCACELLTHGKNTAWQKCCMTKILFLNQKYNAKDFLVTRKKVLVERLNLANFAKENRTMTPVLSGNTAS